MNKSRDKTNMMAILKTNSPVLLSIFVGLLNTVLVMRFLGANQVSDVYFLSFYIATVISALSLMPYEQFIHWYSYFIKVNGKNESSNFVSSNIVTSIIFGILLMLIVNIIAEYIAKFVGPALNQENQDKLSMMLRILSVSIASSPVIFVMRQFLNINGSYSAPYIYAIIPQILITCFLLIYQEKAASNIHVATFLFSIGSLVLLAIYSVESKKLGLNISNGHAIKKYKKQYINSVFFKGGANIHYFSFSYFVAIFLSQINPGAFSMYQYADKIVSACSSISAGPLQNKYIVDISRAVNEVKRVTSVIPITKTYIMSVSILFFGSALSAYVLIPYILPYIGEEFTSNEKISALMSVYVGLAVAKYINILESPSVVILQSRRNVIPFYLINGLYSFLLMSAYFLIEGRTINALIEIIIAANIITFVAYSCVAKLKLKEI